MSDALQPEKTRGQKLAERSKQRRWIWLGLALALAAATWAWESMGNAKGDDYVHSFGQRFCAEGGGDQWRRDHIDDMISESVLMAVDGLTPPLWFDVQRGDVDGQTGATHCLFLHDDDGGELGLRLRYDRLDERAMPVTVIGYWRD